MKIGLMTTPTRPVPPKERSIHAPKHMVADLADGSNIITTSSVILVQRTAEGEFSFNTKNSLYLLRILTEPKESLPQKIHTNCENVVSA